MLIRVNVFLGFFVDYLIIGVAYGHGITLYVFEQIRDCVSSECTRSKRSSAVAASDSSTVRAPRNFLAKVTHTY